MDSNNGHLLLSSDRVSNKIDNLLHFVHFENPTTNWMLFSSQLQSKMLGIILWVTLVSPSGRLRLSFQSLTVNLVRNFQLVCQKVSCFILLLPLTLLRRRYIRCRPSTQNPVIHNLPDPYIPS